jgi:hypothetical protein
MTTPTQSLDDLLGIYAGDIATRLDELGVTPTEYRAVTVEEDEGPGITFWFGLDCPSLAASWPDGLSIVWDPSCGWIDRDRLPLRVPHLGSHADVAQAIRERVTGRPETASPDGPEWGCCHTAEQIAAGKCPEIRPDEIPALRLLALPYAGKPGYQEEWRP